MIKLRDVLVEVEESHYSLPISFQKCVHLYVTYVNTLVFPFVAIFYLCTLITIYVLPKLVKYSKRIEKFLINVYEFGLSKCCRTPQLIINFLTFLTLVVLAPFLIHVVTKNVILEVIPCILFVIQTVLHSCCWKYEVIRICVDNYCSGLTTRECVCSFITSLIEKYESYEDVIKIIKLLRNEFVVNMLKRHGFEINVELLKDVENIAKQIYKDVRKRCGKDEAFIDKLVLNTVKSMLCM